MTKEGIISKYNASDKLDIPKRPKPNWVKWSMEKHTEEEIRDAILNDPEKVCITYICRYSDELSDEFVEELIVLSTGIFDGHPEFYKNPYNVDLVKEILFIEPTPERLPIQRDILNYIKTKDDIFKKNIDGVFLRYIIEYRGPIRSKVDWWQISSYQKNITTEFRKKFATKFKEAKVRSDRELNNLNDYVQNDSSLQ